MDEYVSDVVELVNRTPDDVIFHRLTGTASSDVLLAPQWCSKKWQVLNAITAALAKQAGCAEIDDVNANDNSDMSSLLEPEDLAFSTV